MKKFGGIDSVEKTSAVIGVLGAFVAMILANVIVARQYKRWDWTSQKLYSLSPATLETLHGLSSDVEVAVLLSSGDPLLDSIKHILENYNGETKHLKVNYIDPDRDPAGFMAVQRKYKLEAGRTQDGRVVADAAIIIVRGEKHHFLTPADLVDLSEANEGKSRPRLEQGITSGLRAVLAERKLIACVAEGHGELGTSQVGPKGLSTLERQLRRNNFDVRPVNVQAPDRKTKPWQDCSFVMVAAPVKPWTKAEAAELHRYWKGGGSLFLLLNPIPHPDQDKVVPNGLEDIASEAGVEFDGDLIFELDPKYRLPKGLGEAFFAQPRPHAITDGLLKNRIHENHLLYVLGQSLHAGSSPTAKPVKLLETSENAFGMSKFVRWTAQPRPTEKAKGDRSGPLVLAYASELPKTGNSPADHGPRIVIVGASSLTQNQVWRVPGLRASALFTENSIAWLTAKPPLVDIPDKKTVAAGLQLSDDLLSQVSNYVTLYIPLAATLMGIGVYLRRRSTEKRGEEETKERPSVGKKPRKKKKPKADGKPAKRSKKAKEAADKAGDGDAEPKAEEESQ